MVFPSCRPVSTPAPGVPNSSGTSVSATAQWNPQLRSSNMTAGAPITTPTCRLTGVRPKFQSPFPSTLTVHFLRLSKASCCLLWLSVTTATSLHLLWFIFTGHGDEELHRRAAVLPSLGPASSTQSCPTGPLQARPSCMAKAPGPTHGTGLKPRLFLSSLLPAASRPSGPTSSPLPVATQGHHTPSHSCTEPDPQVPTQGHHHHLQRVPHHHFWLARPHSCPPWLGVITCLNFSQFHFSWATITARPHVAASSRQATSRSPPQAFQPVVRLQLMAPIFSGKVSLVLLWSYWPNTYSW